VARAARCGACCGLLFIIYYYILYYNVGIVHYRHISSLAKAWLVVTLGAGKRERGAERLKRGSREASREVSEAGGQVRRPGPKSVLLCVVVVLCGVATCTDASYPAPTPPTRVKSL
jgi:hypothetical protein